MARNWPWSMARIRYRLLCKDVPALHLIHLLTSDQKRGVKMARNWPCRSARSLDHSMGPPALTLSWPKETVILTIRCEQSEQQPVPNLVCTPRLCNSPARNYYGATHLPHFLI